MVVLGHDWNHSFCFGEIKSCFHLAWCFTFCNRGQHCGQRFSQNSNPGRDLSVWNMHVLPVPVWVSFSYSAFLPHFTRAGWNNQSIQAARMFECVTQWCVCVCNGLASCAECIPLWVSHPFIPLWCITSEKCKKEREVWQYAPLSLQNIYL